MKKNLLTIIILAFQVVQVAMLDKVSFPRLDVCRRVYSPDGIAPTIHTCGGGGTEPKIIVEDCR